MGNLFYIFGSFHELTKHFLKDKKQNTGLAAVVLVEGRTFYLFNVELRVENSMPKRLTFSQKAVIVPSDWPK